MNPVNKAFNTYANEPSELNLKALHRALVRMANAAIFLMLHEEQPNLANEAAELAIMKMFKFEGRSSFHTWAYAIARNVVKMELRKRTSRQEVPLDVNFETPDSKLNHALDLAKIKSLLTMDELTLFEALLENEGRLYGIPEELGLERHAVQRQVAKLRKKLQRFWESYGKATK